MIRERQMTRRKVIMEKRVQNERTIAVFLSYSLTLAILYFAFIMIFYNVELF